MAQRPNAASRKTLPPPEHTDSESDDGTSSSSEDESDGESTSDAEDSDDANDHADADEDGVDIGVLADS